jgi:catechol 2,3-dioxygenase-like lactoylglutathione lyase family enzyme
VANIERIVPIAKVSNIKMAIDFYCSVLGVNEDFHYRADSEGPDYVGLSLTLSSSISQRSLVTDGGPAMTYVYVDAVDRLYAGFARDDCRTTGNWSITPGAREVYVPANTMFDDALA